MEKKYTKAIKAGLICAFLIIAIDLVANLVFFWAMNKPSYVEWVNQQLSGPTNLTGAPPEAYISGFAILAGGLLGLAMYLVAGALAAYFAVSLVKSMSGMVLPGAVAGAVAYIVSEPFSLFFVLLKDMNSPFVETRPDVWVWLFSLPLLKYGMMLAVAIIAASFAALACGFVIRAIGGNRVAA